MFISIITPTFNRIELLNKLYLKLIKVQYSQNFEWVVVYEKSDLSTIFFLKKIKLDNKINIRLVENKDSRKGTGSLFNQGVLKSHGDIVSFLGDDDKIYPNTIKIVLSLFKKEPYKNWLIGCGKYHDLDNIQIRKITTSIKSFLLKNFLNTEFLAIINFVMTPSVFVKKNFFIKNGLWNTSNQYSNDLEFWLKLLKKEEPIISKKFISSTLVGADTITSKFKFEKFSILLKIGFLNLKKKYIYRIFTVLFTIAVFLFQIANTAINFFIKKNEYLKSSNKKKNTILHITRYFQENEYGGIQKLISLIVGKSSLQKFSVAATHPKRTFVKYLKIGTQKIKIYYFKSDFSLKKNVISTSFLINFNKIVKNYDALHFHYPWPFADLVFLLNNFFFQYNKKLIISYHADIVGRYILKYFYYFFLRKFFFKKIKTFHFTSLKYSKIAEVKLKNKNIFISNVGLTNSDMNYNKKKIRSSILKFKKEDKIILFVGADRHYKGSNIVSSYANCNQDINIVVLTNNKNFKEKYQVLSKKCKIYHNVNDNEKNYLLSLSRLLLFPSINKAESLGVILLEAMYFRLPVIGFKINSGTTSVLKNNFNSYLVRLNDFKDFNKKTNLVYTNDTIHSKLSLNSRIYYEKNFTFSKQNFLDIYEK